MEHQDLKELYRDISIDDSELEASRRRLETALNAAEIVRPINPSGKLIRSGFVSLIMQSMLPRYALALTVLAVFGMFVMQQLQPSGLNSTELARLQEFVERNGDYAQLYQQVQQMQDSESELLRLNSLYILSSLGQGEDNILASAQGLIEDPRAEFRAYHLDYLLTYADDAYYDVEYLEALLDRETDPECEELLEELLELAERRQEREPVFI